jgi:site-specific recombinase XerD
MANYVQRACDSIAGFRQRYGKFSKILTIRQYAPGTILNYCSKIAYVCLVYNKLPEDLSEEEIRDYLSSLLTRKPTPGVSQFVHAGIGLRCYYQSMGFPSKKIYIPCIRRRKKLPVVLSGQEMWQLLRQTPDYREKLMLTLLYGLGLRLLELRRLEVRDIDHERMQVHIRQGKGGKDRYVPLPHSCLPLIKLYMKAYHPVKYILYGSRVSEAVDGREVSDVLKKACIRTGLQKKITCHSLRHAFATHALESGMSIVRVKDLLGHCSLRSTMVYLHVANLPESTPVTPLDYLCNLYKGSK